MNVCVGSFQPRSGIGTQTVSGITDAVTGSNFTPTYVMFFSPEGAVDTVVTPFVDSRGIDNGSEGASTASADTSQFAPLLKVVGEGSGERYSLIGYSANAFFAGDLLRLAYISALASGSFTLTYDQNDFTGDTVMFVAFGGTDLFIENIGPILNGTYTTTGNPVASVFLSTTYSPVATPKLATKGAGGGTQSIGFAAKSGEKGSLQYSVINQGGNLRTQRAALACSAYDDTYLPSVSAWGSNTFTITGAASPTVPTLLAISGPGLTSKGGTLTQPGSTGTQAVTVGFKAKWLLLFSAGAAMSTSIRTDQAEIAIGMADSSLRQIGVWAGENISGNGVQVTGARYGSASSVLRFATPNGSSTTFGAVARLTAVSSSTFTLTWDSVDGVSREVYWLAIGDAAVTTTNPIFKADANSIGLDNDTPYRAYVTSRAFLPSGVIKKMATVREGYVTGGVNSLISLPDATVQVTYSRDFGLQTDDQVQTFTEPGYLGSPFRCATKKYDGMAMADVTYVQVTIGDEVAVDSYWAIHHHHSIVQVEGET